MITFDMIALGVGVVLLRTISSAASSGRQTTDGPVAAAVSSQLRHRRAPDCVVVTMRGLIITITGVVVVFVLTVCSAASAVCEDTWENDCPRYPERCGDSYWITICAKFCQVCDGWSPWEAWSICSATCKDGSRSRTRTCSPTKGICRGEEKESEYCKHPSCYDPPEMPSLLINRRTTVNYTTNVNNSVDFTCRVGPINVENLELLKVTKNGSQIVKALSTSSPSLRIQKAGCGDSGIYYCRAGNTLGQTNSTSVQLDVLCSPDVLATTMELKVTEGLEGQTTFEVMASPVPIIDGFISHQEDSNSSQEKPVRSNIFTGKCEQKTPDLHLATCTVYVTQATPTDTGLYSVHVSNSMGAMTVTFELSVTACRDNLTDCPSLASRCGEHCVQELCWKTCSGCRKQTSNPTGKLHTENHLKRMNKSIRG